MHRNRMLPLVGALAVVFTLVVVITPRGRAATPEVLLGRNRIGEYQAVRSAEYLVWQQNTRRDPGHYDVYARPIDGGNRFRVNRKGTNGANGGIQGNRLVYQQFSGTDSDLRFFNLSRRARKNPPRGVNTPQWEYWPSISDGRLLFGRLSSTGVRRIVLFDLTTKTSTVLARTRGIRAFLAPGQINGDWATWSRCPAGRSCDVIRYHISSASKETMPNPGREQRAASVGPDGTAYFARARSTCGTGVRLVSYTRDGVETELWRLPSGDDIGTTRAYVDPDGGTTIYFDHYDCDQAAVSDVWQIVETGPAQTTSPSPTFSPGTTTYQLAITVDPSGAGSVTGTGISCPGDCTEIYAAGTSVTLTAAANAGFDFTAWTGDCSGTGSCSLTMDSNKSVTATFDQQVQMFTLSVSVGGDGTGTVTGSGINCPAADCSLDYADGTSVSLSANPNTGMDFVGWSGACSGTGSCSLTMDANKSVGATFDDPTIP